MLLSFSEISCKLLYINQNFTVLNPLTFFQENSSFGVQKFIWLFHNLSPGLIWKIISIVTLGITKKEILFSFFICIYNFSVYIGLFCCNIRLNYKSSFWIYWLGRCTAHFSYSWSFLKIFEGHCTFLLFISISTVQLFLLGRCVSQKQKTMLPFNNHCKS